METWEWVLIGFAALVAVRHLVRLMRQRRYEVLMELHQEAEEERRRQQTSEGPSAESVSSAP